MCADVALLKTLHATGYVGESYGPAREHRSLAQSCLLYLKHYSNSCYRISTELVEYAAKTWSYHAALQENGDNTEEISLLTSLARKRDWLLIHDPQDVWKRRFKRPLGDIGSGLYYSGLIRLESTVGDLIRARAKISAEGGYCGNALQAALSGGHEKLVQMLMDTGADVKAKGGLYGNVLQAAL